MLWEGMICVGWYIPANIFVFLKELKVKLRLSNVQQKHTKIIDDTAFLNKAVHVKIGARNRERGVHVPEFVIRSGDY